MNMFGLEVPVKNLPVLDQTFMPLSAFVTTFLHCRAVPGLWQRRKCAIIGYARVAENMGCTWDFFPQCF